MTSDPDERDKFYGKGTEFIASSWPLCITQRGNEFLIGEITQQISFIVTSVAHLHRKTAILDNYSWTILDAS
jgi:hypothetical protein